MIADLPRAKLAGLVGRYGEGLSGDAGRCARLLTEACGGEFRDECAALVAAIEQGVTGELRGGSAGSEPRGMLLDRLSRRLTADGDGLASYLARWSVECWAVALGVVPQSDRLMIGKLDGLAPLIERAAGANGALSAGDVDRLIGEAVTRGIDEADARAFLSRYAAARRRQISTQADDAGTPPEAPSPAEAQPDAATPQPSPAPGSPDPPPPIVADPSEPARPQPAFPVVRSPATWWVAGSLVGLPAIAALLIAVVASHQGRQVQSIPPEPPATAMPDQQRQHQVEADRVQQRLEEEQRRRQEGAARKREREQAALAERERQAYDLARGNLAALRAYVNSCTFCAFATDARREIRQLEDADERMYRQSQGNLPALRTYASDCNVCAFKGPALDEIARLESSQQERRPSSTVLCGRPVDYTVDASGGGEPYRSFLGVWTGAAWNSRVCGSLIVESADNDGTAQIVYVYGPLPGQQFRWKAQRRMASIEAGHLDFQDDEGGRFIFRLVGPNMLSAHFVSPRGATSDATLTKAAPPPLRTPIPQGASFNIYRHYDLPGNDLSSVRDTTLQGCAAACSSLRACQAYTFDRWNRFCDLKGGATALILNPWAITGVRQDLPEPSLSQATTRINRYRNKGFPDDHHRTSSDNSLPACEQTCLSDESCMAYTFLSNEQRCLLFDDPGEYSMDGNANSGVKVQRP